MGDVEQRYMTYIAYIRYIGDLLYKLSYNAAEGPSCNLFEYTCLNILI